MSYPPTPQRKACDCSDPCISTDDVYYAGPNLPNSGINTYNVLTEVIEKLDAIYAVPTLQRVTEMGNYTTLPIIADSFVKIGGQPNEFLMADGSTSTGGGGDLITGNGTIDRIPKFTGATTLGNSLIYDNGTNVGINTTNPGYRLEVNGDAYVETDLWVGGVFPLTVKADGGVNIDNSYGLYWYNNVSVPGALAGIGQSNDGLNFFTGASLTSPKMVISSAGLVTLPVVTNALINADVTGKAVVTKEYLTTNNANFVHRAGDTMLGDLILNEDPSTALGAATKQYVDNIVTGINFHAPVVVATDVSLVATYNNGLAGVGATLTGPSVGVLMIDGETPAYLDRILVWQQADPIQNGIYDLTTVGDSVTVYQLTRSSDADNSPPGEIHYGDYTLVLSGDTNGGFGFICNTPGVIDIGITPITYIQFNAAQAVTAGYGLQELTPNVISIDPLVTQEKITLTTTGSGAATLDPLTHVLNIPQADNYWTKTGNDIQNNNIGNTQVKILAGKQFQLLNSANTIVGYIDETGIGKFGAGSTYTSFGPASANIHLNMVRTQMNANFTLGNPQVSQPFSIISTNYFGTSYVAGSAEVSASAVAEHSFNIGNSVGNGITSGIFRISRTRVQSTVPVKYATDLSASYDDRSLVDKGYVVANFASTSEVVLTTTNQNVAGIKTFNSIPIAPTASVSNNSTLLATTEYVDRQVGLGSTAYNILIGSGTGMSNITTETTGTSGGLSYPQNGRNVMINNGATAITVAATVASTPTDFIASYTKVGSANITFTFTGTGFVFITPNGAVLSGSQGSTALLTKNGSTVYLLINNLP